VNSTTLRSHRIWRHVAATCRSQCCIRHENQFVGLFVELSRDTFGVELAVQSQRRRYTTPTPAAGVTLPALVYCWTGGCRAGAWMKTALVLMVEEPWVVGSRFWSHTHVEQHVVRSFPANNTAVLRVKSRPIDKMCGRPSVGLVLASANENHPCAATYQNVMHL